MEKFSIFSSRDHSGYVGKNDHAKKLFETVDSVEEDFIDEAGISGVKNNIQLPPGTPFSALLPSMLPPDLQTEEHDDQTDYYDEFGFRVEEEDGPEQSSSKLLGIPFVEDPQHKAEWVAHLEFTHQDKDELTWENIDTVLPRTEKMRSMVRKGIPHSLRPAVWMRLCGALQKKNKSDTTYHEIVKASSNDTLVTNKAIEKDLVRIMPSNKAFSSMSGTGIPRLRRILRGIAWLFPDIGYCQGTGVIVSSLLLLLEEEDAFWLMATIVEDLLPASYYSSTLLGIQADQRVMQTLITNYLSLIDETLQQHDIELSLITLHWFLTLFAGVVHMKILLRIWDWFFYDGSIILFQLTLGMLKLKEPLFKNLENSAQIFNSLSDIPGDIDDVEYLFKISLETSGSLNQMVIDTHRRRHLAYLMIDHGALVGKNPESLRNLPKEHLAKRKVVKSKSIIQTLLFGTENGEDELKCKNIKQTEILVDLREAILKVARHFLTVEPKLMAHIKLAADYSTDSHTKDHENYINVSRNRWRRAKALHDFERRDDDELGFRKNDIITIISQKDEHCWVGELNGLRGWFPAKFVVLLDERSKEYSSAGDDSLCETVTDLVRGVLCPTLKQVLENGMKRPSFLGGACHPWNFVEEAANREVEKDFESVYSRLVLCKTFRLDEVGKVLTPEELLFRSVQSINQSHDLVHSQMDVKLRSLICIGLNEQILHLWLEVLCNSSEILQKWYHTFSFMNSPAYVQIKCELRILSQFSFNLNPEFELPAKKDVQNHALKEGITDIITKSNLFSWQL